MSKRKKPTNQVKPPAGGFIEIRKPLLPPRPPGAGSNVGDLSGQFKTAAGGTSHPQGTGNFVKSTIQLPHDHGWKAAPGNKVFVANRGDVRFEFPERFVITHGEGAIKLHDAPPPEDACRISVTIWPFPPEVGLKMMKELDLSELLRDATAKGEPNRAEKPGPVTAGKRLNYEWAWLQHAWNDKESGRIVRTRTLMARTPRVNVLISFEFYRDREAEFAPTFEHLMATLRLSEPVTLTMQQGLN